MHALKPLNKDEKKQQGGARCIPIAQKTQNTWTVLVCLQQLLEVGYEVLHLPSEKQGVPRFSKGHDHTHSNSATWKWTMGCPMLSISIFFVKGVKGSIGFEWVV